MRLDTGQGDTWQHRQLYFAGVSSTPRDLLCGQLIGIRVEKVEDEFKRGGNKSVSQVQMVGWHTFGPKGQQKVDTSNFA